MAQTISSPTKEEDDIGARIQKLGLPSKPLIMGKSSATNCVHDGFCFCHVYTTMLDRGPDQPMMPDSPEPESRRSDGRPDHLTKPRHDTTRKTNGRASADTAVNGVPKVAQGKKLPFGEYMKRKNAQATGGPASSSTSPVVERRPAIPTPEPRERPRLLTPPPKRRRTTPPVSPLPPLPQPAPSRNVPTARPSVPTPTPAPPLPPPLPPPLSNKPTSRRRPFPEKLSPTLPPFIVEALEREEREKEEILPLSPTLPPVLEQALREEEESGMMKRSTNAASEKNQRRALPSTNKKNPPIAGRRSPTLQQSPAKSSQSRATSSSSKLSANTGSKSVSKQAPKRNLSPIRQSSPTPPPEAPSLICVLKYSKKQSSRLQTLLKLKPCPIKKDAQARPEKRARPTEDRLTPATPPTKRQKVAEVGASSRAATTKTSVAGKTVHGRPSPPRKANSAPLVAAAVRRTESRNGQTPAAKSDGRIGDIRGDRNEDRSGKKQPPLDPAIQTRLEGFQGENTKYLDSGKQLKYRAEGKVPCEAVAADDRYSRLLLLDSVLCYMVAFLCEQELYLLKGRGSNIESWKSSLPFVRFVSGKCRDIPILLGFGKLLEACILQHILAMETERFERCPLPDASSESLTPNANAAGANDRGRERDYYLNMKSQLLRTIRDTSTAWSEASQNITVDDMRLNYKTTWEKRSLRWVDPATVKPRVGSYKCDYFLPLHPNSTLLEAVNFGYWFLTEWSQIHGLKFKSEIRL